MNDRFWISAIKRISLIVFVLSFTIKKIQVVNSVLDCCRWHKYRQTGKTMADSDSDSNWSDIIKDWTMVNKFGEVEASYLSMYLSNIPVVNMIL